MGSSSMKVHPFARGFWDNHQTHESQPLTLGCKRFRPLAPVITTTTTTNTTTNTTNTNYVVRSNSTSMSFDLKSFVRSESGPPKLVSSSDEKKDPTPLQMESQGGGSRWNPTQEQIGILETLYRGGMRTPNAQQIEKITEQLRQYGKIEGKNVFYWFQNHKARERQKQKRSILGLTHNPRTPPPSNLLTTSITFTFDSKKEIEELQMSPYKKKFRSWTFDGSQDNPKKDYSDGEDKTLELFPLRPEGLFR